MAKGHLEGFPEGISNSINENESTHCNSNKLDEEENINPNVASHGTSQEISKNVGFLKDSSKLKPIISGPECGCNSSPRHEIKVFDHLV